MCWDIANAAQIMVDPFQLGIALNSVALELKVHQSISISHALISIAVVHAFTSTQSSIFNFEYHAAYIQWPNELIFAHSFTLISGMFNPESVIVQLI